MAGNKVFVVIAITTALGILGTFPAAAATDRDRGGNRDRDNVLPCSLVGVNPAYHPDIFGNPAAAAAYGFVRARDGTWQVRPGCRR
jgi:hypothetical protein